MLVIKNDNVGDPTDPRACHFLNRTVTSGDPPMPNNANHNRACSVTHEMSTSDLYFTLLYFTQHTTVTHDTAADYFMFMTQ